MANSLPISSQVVSFSVVLQLCLPAEWLEGQPSQAKPSQQNQNYSMNTVIGAMTLSYMAVLSSLCVVSYAQTPWRSVSRAHVCKQCNFGSKTPYPHACTPNRARYVYGTTRSIDDMLPCCLPLIATRPALPPSCLSLYRLTKLSKVIAHLIGLEMTANPKITLKEATGNALARYVLAPTQGGRGRQWC